MKNKKAISTVVATVLLLLITIIAISVLAAFVIPMVRDNLDETGCIDVLGKVSVDKSNYACYDDTGVKLTIEVGDVDVEEIYVSIYNSDLGGSNSYKLKQGQVSGVEMLDGSSNIVVPDKLTKKTYVFVDEGALASSNPVIKASVAGVVSEKICQETEEIVLSSCQYIL